MRSRSRRYSKWSLFRKMRRSRRYSSLGNQCKAIPRSHEEGKYVFEISEIMAGDEEK